MRGKEGFPMNIKKMLTALLALVMSLFAGCGQNDDTPAPDEMTHKAVITALKVGKADCIVVQTPSSVTMIDTGTEKSVKTIEQFLNEQGITRIDRLIISHYDKDHVGGADRILLDYDVKDVYATSYIAKESDDINEYLRALAQKGLTPTEVRKNTRLTLDGVTWEFFPPQQEDYKKDVSNNSSLVVRMTCGKVSALFTGDAMKARIDELLVTGGLQSDIIKMPHHGGCTKNLDDLLTLVNPRYAILTDSASEPAEDDTTALLKQMGIKTYSTRQGNVTFVTDGAQIAVEQG